MSGCFGGGTTGSGRQWSEREKEEFAQRLRKACFSGDEIAVWLAAPTHLSVVEQARDAEQWRTTGFPAHEAVEWDEVAFDPTDASTWAAAGFTPLQAEYARTQILRRHRDGDVTRMLRDEATWRESGIPPLWICRLLGAGVRALTEAQDLYDRSQTDPTILSCLRLLAGLDGWDFSYLESVQSA